MAWFGLDRVFLGYDLDELQAKGDSLDAQLVDVNTRDYGPGGIYYTPDNWQIVQDHFVTSDTGNVVSSVNDEFVQGAKDGFNNVAKGVQSATNTLFGGLFKILPWQVWIVLALVLFLYMGGGRLLKGALAK